MSTALATAARGMYSSHPNPRVGCVIAKDKNIVATGWHAFRGGPHAEILALEAAGSAAREATAYVTLEPCSHFGHTPPCVDALIEAGIRRVVFAIQDPNVVVNGGGQLRLKAAGLQVESGLMAQAAEDLNPGFLMRMRKNRPWVRVKIASSLDGRTALKNGQSQWITSAASRLDVQAWRARSSAILTGIGTVLADDPAMTARVQDPPILPLRVIADTHWRTPAHSRILLQPSSALIAGDPDSPVPTELAETGVHCLPLPQENGGVDLHALLKELAIREINEVQVEAGAKLCGALLREGLVDEILLYLAPVLLGEGGPGPFALGVLESMQESTRLELLECFQIEEDLRLRLRPLENSAERVDGIDEIRPAVSQNGEVE